jgi:hypothetical protein
MTPAKHPNGGIKKGGHEGRPLMQFPIYLIHQGHIHASRLLPCSRPVLVLLEHPCKHPCHRFNIDAHDEVSSNGAFEAEFGENGQNNR